MGILDSYATFESVIHNGRNMYELVTGVTGKSTVIYNIAIVNRPALVEDIIQFQMFCYEYRNAYVGGSIDEELDRDEIISQSNEALGAIKVRFRCSITRKMVTIPLDKVCQNVGAYVSTT